MVEKTVNLIAIVILLFGLVTWFQIFQEFTEVYVRKSFHLPAIMMAAALSVIFSSRFDEQIKGLGFYVKILGVFVLLVTVYIARTIIGTNGL